MITAIEGGQDLARSIELAAQATGSVQPYRRRARALPVDRRGG